MSRWLGRSRARTFILVCWAVAAAVVALWDFRAAIEVCLGGAYCFVLAACLAERRWWAASAFAAFSGAQVLNLVTAGNQSQVEHDVVFGVSLAALAYWAYWAYRAAGFAADTRTRNRRGLSRL